MDGLYLCKLTLKVARGTIWPKPLCFHLRAMPDVYEQLVAFSSRCASPELGDHFHAYLADNVLLEWHDAFFDDPIRLSASFSEDEVKRFSSRMGGAYQRLVDEKAKVSIE